MMILNYEFIITFFTIVAVTMQFFNWWFLSKGILKNTYILSTIVYFCYLIIDTALAVHDPQQWSMYLFVVVNFWAFIMSIKGTYRLQKEKNESK